MKRLYMVVVVDVDEEDSAFVHTMGKQERLERILAFDIQHVVNDIGYTGHVHVTPLDEMKWSVLLGGKDPNA